MELLIFAIGGVVGLCAGYAIGFQKHKQQGESFVDQNAREHTEKIKQALAYLQGKTEVTNDELERHLKISDTTVGRYLDELEQRGVLRQIGKTGQSVRYAVLK